MRTVKSEGLGRIVPSASLLALLLSLAACAGPENADTPSTATVFEGARLIDGNGGPPIENAVLVVDNGRFVQVGSSGEVQVPAGAARVDLTGRTVMPAIVNAHMHVPQERDGLVQALQHNAYYGAAAIVSLGLDAGAVALEARGRPLPDAAHLRSAGRGITGPEPGRSETPHWVTTEEEARSAVQEEAAKQVDIVKLWVDDRGGQYDKLTPDLYGAAIDEAHQHGLKVTAHIFALEDAKGLLRAGLDAFAHSVRDTDVDGEFIALVQERPEFVLVPNLGASGVAEDLSWLSGTIPAERLAEMQEGSVDRPAAQRSHGIQARNLVAFHEAGVRIAFGTDGGNPWAAHQEMADMVAAGMSPGDVIVAATKTSAEFMDLPDLGTVAAGKSADFIVLDANPLDDIMNTRGINAVYLRGAQVDRASISARLLGTVAQ